jgi:hypothetical protein
MAVLRLIMPAGVTNYQHAKRKARHAGKAHGIAQFV